MTWWPVRQNAASRMPLLRHMLTERVVYVVEQDYGRRGNSPWIAPALLTKYLSTTEHEEGQVADSMNLCPQPLYL